MLTLLLYALLAIIVVAGLFALAVFVLPKGEQLAPPAPDARPWEALPDHQLRPEDVVSARLPVALRGYRFAETDLLLDRLTDELRLRDDEIARLRGARPSVGGLADYGPPNYSEPSYSDPEYSDPEYSDPSYGDPNHGDPNHGDPNHGDPNHGDPGYSDSAPRHETTESDEAPSASEELLSDRPHD